MSNILKGSFSLNKYVCMSLLGVFLLYPIFVSVSASASITLAQADSKQKDVADRLNQEGEKALAASQYAPALYKFQKALRIYTQINTPAGKASSISALGNIASVYFNLRQYSKAVESYSKLTEIMKELTEILELPSKDREAAKAAVNSLEKIITLFKKYIPILAKIESIPEKKGDNTDILTNDEVDLITTFLSEKDNFKDDLMKLKDEFLIIEELFKKYHVPEAKGMEASRIEFIAFEYIFNENFPKALENLQNSLKIYKRIGDPKAAGYTLHTIGTVYERLKKYPKALESFQKSLAIYREIGYREGEALNLSSIGNYYSTLNQPESAISFLKRSINIYEAIRKDNRLLTREQWKSYAKQIESPYRRLSELLLSQGRLLEAQKILEFLKIREIYSIDRENRAVIESAGIEYNPLENEIIKQHGNLVSLGEKYYNCESNPKCNDVQKRQLRSQLQALQQQFDKILADAEKTAKNRILQNSINGKDDFIKSYQNLVEAQPGTLLIYPFVTEDKIWLLWSSAGGVLGSTEVPKIGRVKLSKAVADYRNLLQTPTNDPAILLKLRQSGQQLYEWLIKPLEPALASKTIKHLIFSLDSITRYIPISALVGSDNQYLIEHYTVSTVLNASWTDTSDRLPKSPQLSSVLGLGVSLGFPPEFKALKNVESELKTIVKAPGDTTGLFSGEKFLNARFNQQTLADHLKGQNILHIATHAKFLSTNPDESYLLLGNGQKYPIRDIKFLRNLGKVHLVVLSACETALGGSDSDGREILGISSYFTGGPSKAKAVLASLWNVNDTSTSLLMQSFYQNLSKGTMTKSEALRQAQLRMIKNISPQNYNHPYYWAPFILMGNGL
jgi:CHAT domain-containing protein